MEKEALIWLIIGVAIINFLILGWLINLRLKFKSLFESPKGNNLEKILQSNEKKLNKMLKNVEKITVEIKGIKNQLAGSLQKVGLVKYQPFGKNRSNQSFCLALLDEKNNGIIINSLIYEGMTKLFIKEIKMGQAKQALSEEEKQALKKAINKTN